MKSLSDKALARLRETPDEPGVDGTRYSLLERVARGGMGVVYAARDEKLDRRVALKVLDTPDSDGELASRLTREAQILARLEHPGIVPVHDVGTLPDGRVFYTMKFVEGLRLDTFIESLPSIPDRLRLFLRICDAVAFAHLHGVLHRDLKPANVMVGPFGEVLVMDWGLAKILRSQAPSGAPESAIPNPTAIGSPDATGHGVVMGTPGYMPPEQARGNNDVVDQRSDVFSLGALLRFLLNQPPSSSAHRIDKSLDAICAKAAAEDRNNRYSTVLDLAADISLYLEGLPVTARNETLLDKAGRFYRRHSVAILLITAYLLMRVVLLLFSRR
jgi:eukaryotic-like serine/threonine-protein kinase